MFTMERSTLRSGRRFFVVFVTAMVLSNGCNRMFMGCFRPVLGDVRSFFVWIFSITVLAIESFRWLRIMFVMFQVRGQRCFCQRQFDLIEERVCYSLARCVCDDPIKGKICSCVDNSFIQLLFDGSLPSGESFWYVFSDLLLTDAESFLVVTIDFWSIYAEDTENLCYWV